MTARVAGSSERVGVSAGGGFILSAPCVGFLERSMNMREGSRKYFLLRGGDERGNDAVTSTTYRSRLTDRSKDVMLGVAARSVQNRAASRKPNKISDLPNRSFARHDCC